MTAHEVTLSSSLGARHNVPWPITTITTDERYSVSSGKADLLHRVAPRPCGLFTLMETRNLIWQDGSVLLPLPCAAGSPSLTASSPACPAYTVLSHKIKYFSLHVCYVMVGAREMFVTLVLFSVLSYNFFFSCMHFLVKV